MSKRVLVVTYDQESGLLAGARSARANDLKVVDAYCPYPVHGLDGALGLRPSRLTWVCFAFGAFGVLFMTWFQFWTTAVSWPLNIGGKPWNSLPAFAPPIFEMMVLCGGLGTVAVLFYISRLRPGRAPDLVVPGVTDDRFALVIEHENSLLDPADVRRLLSETRPIAMEERVFERRQPRTEQPREDRDTATGWRAWFGTVNIVLLVTLLILALFIYWGPRNAARPNWELFREMYRSPASGGLSSNTILPGGITLQPPVPGTIARDQFPFYFQPTEQDAIRAGRELKNPYAPKDGKPDDAAVLERGRVVFKRFCACCHGPKGLGDGPVALRGFPPPPSYAVGKSNDMPDGQVFHIITRGQKNMPPYAPLVSVPDRWKVIRYVRKLQTDAKKAAADAAAKAAELAKKQKEKKPQTGKQKEDDTPQKSGAAPNARTEAKTGEKQANRDDSKQVPAKPARHDADRSPPAQR